MKLLEEMQNIFSPSGEEGFNERVLDKLRKKKST